MKISYIIKKCIFTALILNISSIYSNNFNFRINLHLFTKQYTGEHISHLWFFSVKKEKDHALAPMLKLNAFDNNIDPLNLPTIISNLFTNITYKISLLERYINFEDETIRIQEIKKLNLKDLQEEEETEGEDEKAKKEKNPTISCSWKQSSEEEILPLIERYVSRAEHSFIITGEHNADFLRDQIIQEYGYKEQHHEDFDIEKANTTEVQEFFKKMPSKLEAAIAGFQADALEKLENYLKYGPREDIFVKGSHGLQEGIYAPEENNIDPTLNMEKVKEIKHMINTCHVDKKFLLDMYQGFEKEVDYVVEQANKRVITQVNDQEVNQTLLEIVDIINKHEKIGKHVLNSELRKINKRYTPELIAEARKQIRHAKRVHNYASNKKQENEKRKQDLFPHKTPHNKTSHHNPQHNHEKEQEKFFREFRYRRKIRAKRKHSLSNDNIFEPLDQDEKIQNFEKALPSQIIKNEEKEEIETKKEALVTVSVLGKNWLKYSRKKLDKIFTK